MHSLRTSILLLALILVAGCRKPAPEGVYPCRPETVATDCFAGWWCRADHTCWITPDPTDGGSDAGVRDASSLPDGCACASATAVACTTSCGSMGTGLCTSICGIPVGAACSPPAESCNTTDDDCDGLIDEALATVSSETCAGACAYTAPSRVQPRLVGLADGTFDLIFHTGMGTEFMLQRIGPAGIAMGLPIGLGIVADEEDRIDLAYDGVDVLIAWRGPGTSSRIAAVSATDGTRSWGPYELPMQADRRSLGPRLVSVRRGGATVYVPQLIMNGAGGIAVRRYRLDTTGAAPVVRYEFDAVVDGFPPPFDVVATLSGDVVLYRTQTGDVRLAIGGPGDAGGSVLFRPIGTVQTASQQPGVVSVALAVRSASEVVDAANPIVVAWQRSAGMGTFVARIESVASPTLSGLTMLPASYGAPNLSSPPEGIDVFATPEGSASAPRGTRFYLASIEGDPASTTISNIGTLNVWEWLATGAPRSLAVPGELAAVRHVSGIASSGQSLRVAEENRTGDVVTRGIGCL